MNKIVDLQAFREKALEQNSFEVKQNRFSLLKEVCDTASTIADFSKLQTS